MATYSFNRDWQGVVRYEGWTPDKSTSTNSERDLTLGINYFMEAYNAKLQLNYIRRDYTSSSNPNENIVMSAVQIAF